MGIELPTSGVWSAAEFWTAAFQIQYNSYQMKESLRGDECDSDEGVMKNLEEYFQEYEKEFHMEEFLSKIYNYGTLVPIS